jgi:6-pyruvoyltetrahydropterin/6-carboxytetrahydropterin synthase
MTFKNAERLTTVKLSKEYLKFSAAHFTIFSATERERLHGHNFNVAAEIVAPVSGNGMSFNYRAYKDKLKKICQEIDEYILLPFDSPFLTIIEDEGHYQLRFNNETMYLLKSDVLLLPIRNSTAEEYSYYILNRLLEAEDDIMQHDIRKIVVSVSSGPGQSGSSEWAKPDLRRE